MVNESLQQNGSFIVRIWWEGATAATQRGHWRGWVQHVRHGKQIYFTNLRDLAAFIEQELGIDPVSTETPPGLV